MESEFIAPFTGCLYLKDPQSQIFTLCGWQMDGIIAAAVKGKRSSSTRKNKEPRPRLFWIAPYDEWRKRGDFTEITCTRCNVRHAIIVANNLGVSFGPGLRRLREIEEGHR